MIRLVIFDAGGTIGRFTKLGTKEILAAISPLPREIVAEESRRFLHCVPVLTESVIDDICGALLIDRRQWPNPWPASGFLVFPEARRVLGELTAEFNLPIIILSNLPITCGPQRMSELRDQLHPYAADVYTSYSTGLRKPDPRLWTAIARRYGVRPDQVVHIGDEWFTDICGAVKAGCHAIYLNPDHTLPPEADWPPSLDLITVATNLEDVLLQVRALHTNGRT